jgi:hypothetical protein
MNIAVEVPFASPRPLNESELQSLGGRLLKEFSLPISEVSLNVRDKLFDYDLNLRLFRGSAHIRVAADKMEVRFQELLNPSQRDLELIKGALAKAGSILKASEAPSAFVQVDIHAKLSEQSRKDYFAKVLPSIGTQPLQGAVFYRSSQHFTGDIRVQLERSNVFDNALFFHWTGSASTAIDGTLFDFVSNEVVADLAILDLAFSPID